MSGEANMLPPHVALLVITPIGQKKIVHKIKKTRLIHDDAI